MASCFAMSATEAMLSPDEYIAGELKSEIRHEYLAGRVYAMAGASLSHNLIAGNFFLEIATHLRGKKCQVFASDMKIHLQDQGDNWFYYPDVMVNCDPAGQQRYFCETPSVIIEVLAPDTERTDRREKLLAYQRLASLQTYILADREKREITVYERVSGGWEKSILTQDATLTIPSLDFSISLDALYARTDL